MFSGDYVIISRENRPGILIKRRDEKMLKKVRQNNQSGTELAFPNVCHFDPKAEKNRSI